MNKQRKMLRERLLRSEILVLPGVYDALTAKIAAEVGFDALVMGGSETVKEVEERNSALDSRKMCNGSKVHTFLWVV